MSEYECSCGRSFPTLTRLRLHQRDECPDREELDLAGKDVEEQVERIAEELMECERCGIEADEIDDVREEETGAGEAIIVEFTCWECGVHNRNKAFLEEPHHGG